MKVKELIKELQKLDPELSIYQSKDPEGNSFNRTLGVDRCFVDNPNAYCLEELFDDPYDQFSKPVAVLWC